MWYGLRGGGALPETCWKQAPPTPCRTGAQESCWGGWNSSKVGLEPWRVPSPGGGSTPVSKAKSLRLAYNPGPSSMGSLTHICSIYLTAQGHPYSSLARSVCPVCSLGQQAPTRSTKHISAHLLPARPSLTPPPHHHHHSCGMQNIQQAVTATGSGCMSQQQCVLAMVCNVVSCYVWLPIILGTILILQVGKLGLGKRKGLP